VVMDLPTSAPCMDVLIRVKTSHLAESGVGLALLDWKVTRSDSGQAASVVQLVSS